MKINPPGMRIKIWKIRFAEKVLAPTIGIDFAYSWHDFLHDNPFYPRDLRGGCFHSVILL